MKEKVQHSGRVPTHIIKWQKYSGYSSRDVLTSGANVIKCMLFWSFDVRQCWKINRSPDKKSMLENSAKCHLTFNGSVFYISTVSARSNCSTVQVREKSWLGLKKQTLIVGLSQEGNSGLPHPSRVQPPYPYVPPHYIQGTHLGTERWLWIELWGAQSSNLDVIHRDTWLK